MTCEILSWNVIVTKYNALNMVCIHHETSDIAIPCEVTDDENLENTINKVLLYTIQLHKKRARFIAVDVHADEDQRLISMLDEGITNEIYYQ